MVEEISTPRQVILAERPTKELLSTLSSDPAVWDDETKASVVALVRAEQNASRTDGLNTILKNLGISGNLFDKLRKQVVPVLPKKVAKTRSVTKATVNHVIDGNGEPTLRTTKSRARKEPPTESVAADPIFTPEQKMAPPVAGLKDVSAEPITVGPEPVVTQMSESPAADPESTAEVMTAHTGNGEFGKTLVKEAPTQETKPLTERAEKELAINRLFEDVQEAGVIPDVLNLLHKELQDSAISDLAVAAHKAYSTLCFGTTVKYPVFRDNEGLYRIKPHCVGIAHMPPPRVSVPRAAEPDFVPHIRGNPTEWSAMSELGRLAGDVRMLAADLDDSQLLLDLADDIEGVHAELSGSAG